MAILTCTCFSTTLKQNVTFNAVVPTPEGNEQVTDQKAKSCAGDDGFPVVYLLHGAYGNYASWGRFSSIERYAQQYGLVLIMASAENSFYQDMARGGAYFTFFTQELPALVRHLFPVSHKREKTFTVGFSMGGYGAWYLALSRPDLYGKAVSMSGALDIVATYEQGQKGVIDSPFPWENIFADPHRLEGSPADLFALYQADREKGCLPQLYHTCGRSDFLYGMNQSVQKRLAAMGADVPFVEGDGGHDWDYWDKTVRQILPWLCEE